MSNYTVLVWLDKNWYRKGLCAAENLWLDINHDKRTFRKTISCYSDIAQSYIIEVKRKSDIKDYIEHLKSEGYVEEK